MTTTDGPDKKHGVNDKNEPKVTTDEIIDLELLALGDELGRQLQGQTATMVVSAPAFTTVIHRSRQSQRRHVTLVAAAVVLTMALAGAAVVRKSTGSTTRQITSAATADSPGTTAGPPATIVAVPPLRLSFDPAFASIRSWQSTPCCAPRVLAENGPTGGTDVFTGRAGFGMAGDDRRIVTYRADPPTLSDAWVQVTASPVVGTFDSAAIPADQQVLVAGNPAWRILYGPIGSLRFQSNGKFIEVRTLGVDAQRVVELAAAVKITPDGWPTIAEPNSGAIEVRTARSKTPLHQTWVDYETGLGEALNLTVEETDPASPGAFEEIVAQLLNPLNLAGTPAITGAPITFKDVNVRGHRGLARIETDVVGHEQTTVIWEEADRHAVARLELLAAQPGRLDAILAALMEVDEQSWNALAPPCPGIVALPQPANPQSPNVGSVGSGTLVTIAPANPEAVSTDPAAPSPTIATPC